MRLTLKALSLTLVFLLAFSSALVAVDVAAVTGTNLSYDFKNDKAGYAEGTITLESDTAGNYKLYWANASDALSGYYPIAEMDLSAGSSESFSFGYHTAIPAGATRVIAKNSAGSIVAQYSLDSAKLLSAGNLLYKFNSYSDVHIDNEGFYVDASTHWGEALKFAVDTNTDFIVSSGDMVTNAAGPDGEWDVYEKILAQSDYVNPVWESDGNHDLRTGAATGIASFVRASGTDNTIANYDANKPYYYVTEKNTGDIFIFMALESEYSPNGCDEFSDAQMNWLTNLLETYYGTGVNIYIVEHSPIEGFGAGDRMSQQYYKALLSEKYMSTVRFKSLLKKYPKLIFMSGHTHEDFSMGYNFSDEDGTACSMIHNPAVAGSTMPDSNNTALDYNEGHGYNSQGYLVEVYDNSVVYYGANLTDELIYPAYCYIMDGARGTDQSATNATEELTTADPNLTTGITGCTVPDGIDTQRVYFANTVKWGTVNCHSWTTVNQSVASVWPGYGAVYYGTTEQGVDLYYCDIPAEHTGMVWNNGNNGSQTVDITIDGVNNFFTATSLVDGKYQVTASVWEYAHVTDPSSSEDNSSSSDVTDPSSSSEDNSSSSDVTDPSSSSEDNSSSSDVTDPSSSSEDNSSSSDVTEPSSSSEQESSSSQQDSSSSQQESSSSQQDSSSSQQDSSSSQQESSSSEDPVIVYKTGDVDKDEKITINDVTTIQLYLAGRISFSDEQLALADTSGDDKVNINDATYIQLLLGKRISKLPADNQKSAKYPTGAVRDDAKEMLDTYYSFASYDQYQNLKKLYRNGASDSELTNAINSLKTIAEHIGLPGVYPIRDIYYFENTYDWPSVSAYAWSGSSSNASWPGTALQKVGTNYGHDVYGIKFDYAGQYKNIIFNNGNGTQTVDITLEKWENNCFYISGQNTEGKLTVENFDYNSPVEPTLPTTSENNVEENEHYLLLFYQKDVHDWNGKDKFFQYTNGEYVLDYTSTSANSMSLSLFNNKNSKYLSVQTSTSMSFSTGVSSDFTLTEMSSRGKSITINGLAAGSKLRFKFDPNTNKVTVTCL